MYSDVGVVVKVSNGALDMAKTNMELLLCHCAKPLSLANSELSTAQSKSMFDTVHELVRHVTSPNTVVRDQVSLALYFSALLCPLMIGRLLTGELLPG